MSATGKSLSWSVHPARERVRAAVFAVVVILTISGAIYLSTRSIWWSAIAVPALVASLNRFFFPSRFTVGPDGITADYLFRTQRYLWRDIRRFRHDAKGGYLSTRTRPSRLDVYRGMHLLFSDRPDDVIGTIQRYLREAGCR